MFYARYHAETSNQLWPFFLHFATFDKLELMKSCEQCPYVTNGVWFIMRNEIRMMVGKNLRDEQSTRELRTINKVKYNLVDKCENNLNFQHFVSCFLFVCGTHARRWSCERTKWQNAKRTKF